MKSEYTYYAFISYNNRDEKWAKMLQYQLQHYRLPSLARKEIGEDVKIRPVFRYVTNLGLGDLHENLGKELEASKYLIVICSPNSAQPNIQGKHWVNDEISRFISLGRKNRIIPVIVDGTPNSDDDQECFPPALRHADIAGVDVTVGTRNEKRHAFLKIVAKLLDLKPEILTRYVEEEDKVIKRRAWWRVAPLIALALLGGLFAWDATRQTCNYYVNYVDSYGLPKGIFKLLPDELSGRHVHYRFEYEGIRFGRSLHADSSNWSLIRLFGFHRVLKRVVQAAADGKPRKWNHTEYGSRPPLQEFTVYDKRGIVREIRYWKFAGDGSALRLDKRLLLSDNDGVVNGLLTFKGKDDRSFLFAHAETMTKASNEDSGVPRSVIAQHVFTRTPDGGIKSTRFLDAFAKPSPNGDGVWGFSFVKHDELGRVEVLWYLGPDGKTHQPNKMGVAGRRYEYKGHVMKKAEYVDAKGIPTICHHGWMVCVDDFDEHDNNIGSMYYDASGYSMVLKEGYAGCCTLFDPVTGEESLLTFVDANKNPVMRSDGFCSIRRTYDNCGRETSRTFLDENGNPVICEVGGCCAVNRMEYSDESGFRTAWRLFGPDGKTRMSNKSGVSGSIETRDDEGRVTSARYLGTNDAFTVSSDGYCEVRFAYGEGGSVTNMSFFGTNGCAVADKNGISSVVYDYDKFGNESRKRFLGIDGKQCVNSDGEAGYDTEYVNGRLDRFTVVGMDGKAVLSKGGYAICKYLYDSRGNKKEVRYLDSAGNLVLQPEGYAIVRYDYDRFGRNIARSYFDVEEIPVGGSDNAARITDEYDIYGHVIERRYYGVDGKPVYTPKGEAGYSSRFDNRGNETNRIYLAADGTTPTASEHGVVRSRWEYDSCGRATRMDYLDRNGKRMCSKEGYAGWTKKYDVRGRMIHAAVHGVDGSPCLAKNGVTGYTCTYDELDHEIGRRYFGTDGRSRVLSDADNSDNGTAGWDKVFDNCGNMLSQKWLDAEGRPVMRSDGYAEIRYKYDEAGRMLAMSYFGTNGMAIAASKGIAEVKYIRDKRGNCSEESYFDAEGNPCAEKGQTYTSIHWEYDAHNKVTSKEFWKGGARTVADADTGFYGFRYVYDQNLRETECIAYGKDGTSASLTGGFARRERTYDKHGRRISEIHYDKEGYVMTWNWKEKYAYSVSTFDASGHETSRRYYGADKKPCKVKGEEFGWNKTYDSSGRCIQIMWVGANGLPAIDANGIAGARFSHGADGRLESKIWLNAEGNPTIHRAGNAGYRVGFNDRGKETFREFTDDKGRLVSVGGCAYVGWTNQYDSAGNLVGELWFDAGRRPANNGEGFARTKKEYDSRGNLTREWRYDADDNPVAVRPDADVWSVEKTYDDRGKVVSERYFDKDGKPHLCKAGYWGFDACITKDGQRDVTTFVGLDGKPKASKLGCARMVLEYDAYGHLTLKEYRGLDGTLVAIDRDGEAGFRCRFDSLGRETMREYFGTDGKPIFCSGGYSRFKKTYDARGNLTCAIYFDEKGNVILANKQENYAYAVKTFDLDGHETSRRYYWVDHSPCKVKGEDYGWDKTFDQQGRDSRIMWVGPDGKPTAAENDVAGRKFEYKGAQAFWCKATWLNAEEKPTRHKDGEVVTRRTFDSNGNVTWIKFFEADGITPVAIEKSGLAGYRSTYDGNGNEVYRQNFGADETPIENNEGWASFQRRYDGMGRIVQTWLFDRFGGAIMIDDDMKIYSTESSFDAKGNVIRKVYFGADRKPCLNAEGIAGYNACFDDDGREVSRRFFDLEGKPAAVAGRFFGWDKTYDAYGNETARIELDAKGAVLPDPDGDGAAYRTKVFDSQGRQLGWFNCDTNRLPTVDCDGCAGAKFSYDRRGRIVRVDFLGPDGKPHAIPKSNVAGRRNEYSADGYRVTAWWIGESGEIIQHPDGNAGFIDYFDSQQRRIQREFINAQGQNVALKNGCAREVWVYGSSGEVVLRQRLGKDGKPISK